MLKHTFIVSKVESKNTDFEKLLNELYIRNTVKLNITFFHKFHHKLLNRIIIFKISKDIIWNMSQTPVLSDRMLTSEMWFNIHSVVTSRVTRETNSFSKNEYCLDQGCNLAFFETVFLETRWCGRLAIGSFFDREENSIFKAFLA